jgi:hypothetical protein
VDDPQPVCQWISGKDVDEAVDELLLEIVTPVAIEVTLALGNHSKAAIDYHFKTGHREAA